MYHMRRTLNEDMHVFFNAGDPRVKSCIVEFLRVRMQKYAKDHSWQFDPQDFVFGAEGQGAAPTGAPTPESVSKSTKKKTSWLW